MNRILLGLSLLAGLGVLMAGCGDSGSSCPTGQVDCDGVCIDEIAPTLVSIQSEIFDRSCAASTCHDSELPASELDLSTAAASGSNLVSVNSVQVPESLRVAPNDSNASYLMNKILGVDMALGTVRMPQNDSGFVLCEPQVNAIRQWIDAGAAPAPSN